MKRSIRVLLCVALILSALASFGVGSHAAEKTGTAAYPGVGGGIPANLKVGFSELSISDPWRVAQVASMQAEADRRGINYVMTDAQNKQDKQVSDIEDLIAQGCNFIFLAPLNVEGFEPAVEKAKEKQVPIVCIDREIAGTPGIDMVTTVLSDFILQGTNCANWLDKNVKGDLKVVQITGQPGGSDVRDRTNGFAAAMERSTLRATRWRSSLPRTANGREQRLRRFSRTSFSPSAKTDSTPFTRRTTKWRWARYKL